MVDDSDCRTVVLGGIAYVIRFIGTPTHDRIFFAKRRFGVAIYSYLLSFIEESKANLWYSSLAIALYSYIAKGVNT